MGIVPETIFHAADGQRFDIRPMRESDEPLLAEFLEHADRDDIRLRFFASIRTFDHRFLWPLVHYDHEQAIALVALEPETGRVAAGARLHCDIMRSFGEFAIFVRADLKGEGLGRFLMERLIGWARDRSIPLIRGEVLRENSAMLALCRRLGFSVKPAPGDPGLMNVELAL